MFALICHQDDAFKQKFPVNIVEILRMRRQKMLKQSPTDVFDNLEKSFNNKYMLDLYKMKKVDIYFLKNFLAIEAI